jgi:hypothetical protein
MAKKTTRRRAAAPRYRFQYAVKFLCTSHIPGTSQTSSAVLPGNYQTAVNIHNPGRQVVYLRKKLADTHGNISQFFDLKLAPDEVTTVDCSQVQSFGLHLVHGFEGFLVVEATSSLDVVAVYTAGPRGGEVSSLDIEHVPERRIG